MEENEDNPDMEVSQEDKWRGLSEKRKSSDSENISLEQGVKAKIRLQSQEQSLAEQKTFSPDSEE